MGHCLYTMATLFEEKKKKLTALDLATRGLAEERAAAKPEEEEEEDEGIKSWTSAGTIARLITKEATDYYNLDPYRVLGLKWNATFEEAKKRYRKVSLLVHPDRNQSSEEANQAFDSVKKAYSMLETTEKWDISARIVKEAMCRVEDEIKASQKEAKRKGELFSSPKKEELEIAVGVSITKIYGEMENKRRDLEQRESNAKKRMGDQETERRTERAKKVKMEKQWEDTRDVRMTSWNSFMKKGRKKRRDFRPLDHMNIMESRNNKEVETLDKHHNDEEMRHKQVSRDADQSFKKQWR